MNYTARQAFHTSNQILNNFESVYTHIAFMCMENIQRYSEFHFNCCTFSIPRYVMGFATFDAEKVKDRLRKHLKSLEYRVKTSKTDKNTICISWGHIFKSVLGDGSIRVKSQIK